MALFQIINVADLLLWLFFSVSVVYVFFFSLASLLPKRRKVAQSSNAENTFLVLIPAYREDKVIRPTVTAILRQDYPSSLYSVTVVSDHQTAETNQWLAGHPLTLLTPQFDKSSKARALQYAVDNSRLSSAAPSPNYVVILDADNVVDQDFLSQLNGECLKGYKAVQCHRTAKNANNDIAVLDGLSEEINNSIFRRGHNRLGLSSALIGSGMCFTWEWFLKNVYSLDSAVEDRELEALLMRQGIYIHYAEDILVKDEKVSSGDNFQRQRLRWMTGQLQALLRMMPYIPRAIATFNINYIDKTLQQALVPRSILLVLTPFFSLLSTLFSLHPLRWWTLTVMLAVALLLAIPPQMRRKAVLGKAIALPGLAWRMLKNIIHIRSGNKDFIHTTHDQ